ncbi:MAG: hypothetical protein JWL63_2599 [Rhodocyclales bacterium]|nr:hypothetical protein [Rhodocyclales bacterium]
MKIGAVVMFADPLDEDEKLQRFVVKELRGNRVLVQDTFSRFFIRPTFVYLSSDLVVTREELLPA